MPGIIQGSLSTDVLPLFLCKAFTQEREYLININEYKNKESQREVIVFNSRKKWILSSNASATVILALRNFYLARDGGTRPFIFYDFSEGTTKFNYDPTGVSASGRFLVRFDGKWTETFTVSPVGEAAITLVELIEGLGDTSFQMDFQVPDPTAWLGSLF